MVFSEHVKPETAYRATFNYYEPGWTIEVDGWSYTVYHTKHPHPPEPNFVVIESDSIPKRFYFRAFRGKHPGECDSVNGATQFMDILRDTVDDTYRVEPDELDNKISETVDSLEKGELEI